MNSNRSDKKYWSEGGGYYRVTPDQLRRTPLPFPDVHRKVAYRILEAAFRTYFSGREHARLLEIGCGGSAYLPYFHERFALDVAGIDYDEYAAELARANLEGHGVAGAVFCRDALDGEANRDLAGQFDIVFSAGVVEHFRDPSAALEKFADFLKPRGLIFTTVPNFRGIYGLVQRLLDGGILDMHELHTVESLRRAHEAVGFRTKECRYFGVYNGWLTEGGRLPPGLRRTLHQVFCRCSNAPVMKALSVTGYRWLPESAFFSPYLLYVGEKTT